MTLNAHTRKILVVCACLLAANGLLQWMIDGDLGMGWAHNVLRNWEQFGFFQLKGELVSNPAGRGAVDHPIIYPGHRAASLYPAYFIGRVFAWTGLHAMPYHVITTLVILLSIWRILGGTDWGFLAGAVCILCPGYILWPTNMDPNAVAFLAGIPYFALLLWRLRQPKFGVGDIVLIAVFTVAFTLLNWSTALAHGLIFLTLASLRLVSWRHLAVYTAAAVAAAGLVAAAAVMSKLSAAPASGAGHGLSGMLGNYGWGSGGYSHGSGTATLLARIAFINGLALFPFWIFWLWALTQRARRDAQGAVIALVPLFAAAGEAAVMRNYFGHHPWMTAPLLLLAGVLSLFALTKASAAAPAPAPFAMPSFAASAAAVAAVFVFGLAILLIDHAHSARENSLIALVRDTPRDADIILDTNRDSETSRYADRLPEEFDRCVVLAGGLPAPAASNAPAFLLTAAPLQNGWKPAGQTSADAVSALPGVAPALDWFSQHIAKRKAGDRMELAETYYIYPIPPAGSSLAAGAKP